MKPYRGLYIYPWDILDHDDLASFAGRIREMGINTLCVGATYHTGKFLRPHGQRQKVFFPQDGATYLPIQTWGGSISPIIATRGLGMEALQVLHAQGLQVAAWTVLLHNTALGTQYPQFTCHNAFGDCYPYSLCPSHAAVREYGVNLCREMGANPYVSQIICETPGWQPFRHGFHHEMSFLAPNIWADTLMGLCFCGACMAWAAEDQVNVTAVRQRVAACLSCYMDRPDDAPAADGAGRLMQMLVCDDDLRDFLRWRCRQVTSFVAQIRAAVREQAEVYVIPSVMENPVLSWVEGSDLAALSQVCDGLELCLYGGDTRAALSRLADIRDITGNQGRLRTVLRPASGDFDNGAAFVAQAHALARCGVDGFGFYNFGHLRRENLHWIEQAAHAVQAQVLPL